MMKGIFRTAKLSNRDEPIEHMTTTYKQSLFIKYDVCAD